MATMIFGVFGPLVLLVLALWAVGKALEKQD